MKSMQRVFEAMKKAHKKSDKTDAKNILYRYNKWYQSGAKYPLQRPRDWFQKLLAEDDNDDIVFGDEMEIVETISLLDEQDENNTIDMETWVLECILIDSNLVKLEGGKGGSNDIVVKDEVGGDEEDDCGDAGDADVGKLEVKWMKHFNALKEYKCINGQHKDPPQRYKHVVKYEDGKEDEIKLGIWCNNQRRAKKGQGRYTITKNQIKQLNSINFIWDRHMFIWNRNFNALKEYKSNNGQYIDPPWNYKHVVKYDNGKEEEIKLGLWCNTQRNAKKGQDRHTITKEQIKQLNSINFIWDPLMFIWNRNFNALKEYKSINGQYKDPPRKYKHVVKYDDGEEEEINLWYWCNDQRNAKKGQGKCTITKKQIKQLSGIGFKWNPKIGCACKK